MSRETSTQKRALLGACALVVEEKTFGGSHSCSDLEPLPIRHCLLPHFKGGSKTLCSSVVITPVMLVVTLLH